jgi:hypothetical protein
LSDEGEEVVARDQDAALEQARQRDSARAAAVLPAPGGPVTTINTATVTVMSETA